MIVSLALAATLASADLYSACLPKSERFEDVCAYRIAEINEKGKHGIEVAKNTSKSGDAVFVRSYVIPYPAVKGQLVGASGIACRFNGQADPQVFAIAQFDDSEEFSTVITAAWQFDGATEQALQLNPQLVSCENEGWGI